LFNVNEFKSYIAQSGFLHPSKKLVRINLPLGMQAGGELNTALGKTARAMEYYCEVSNLPGVMVNTHDHRRYGYGPTEKKPHAPLFNDVQFIFLSDGDAAVWTFWQQWIKLVLNYDARNGIVGNTGDMGVYEVNYKDQYVSDIEVTQFNNYGEEAITTVLRDAFPIMVNDIPLAWSDSNNISRIPVTITFFDWYNKNVT
jgi:hypothetical protein